MKNERFKQFLSWCGSKRYHLVWKPKYAKDPFKFVGLHVDCEQFLKEIAEQYKFIIYELVIEPDHIHMFVEIPPTVSVSKALQLFKGISSYKLFRKHPWLRKHFKKGHFWSPEKFFRSVGNVTTDTIKSYINDSYHGWNFPKRTTLTSPTLF